MNEEKEFLKIYGINNKIIIQRLTALWALNECVLGGVMHAFKLPFTGILVGGLSILLITLIAFYATNTWSTLLKALTIVLLIKAGISPSTPITAYVAVSFQAFLGILFYSLFSINNVTVIILCAVTFLESALQKLIILTIIFGQSLWKSVDVYMDWISNQLSFLPFTLNSKTLIYTFLGTYFFSGIVVGFVIIRTIKLIQQFNASDINFEIDIALPATHSNKHTKKRLYFFLILLVLALIPILYYNNDSKGWQNALFLVTRSALILIIWYTLLGPLSIHFLNRLLSKKREIYQTDLRDIINIFPSLKAIIYHSWKDCRSFKGMNRLSQFLAKSIAYSLYFDHTQK
ncbi:MAG: hypothetical protein ABI371_00855 [Gelidibacter sp.]